ncbi:MAG: ATP-binding protein [bacterium]|nr:ATP-binding protein [bacterium]
MINGYSIAIWIAAVTMASFAFILLLLNKKPSTRAAVVFSLLAALWAGGVGTFYYVTTQEVLAIVALYNHLMGLSIATAFFFFGYLLSHNRLPSRFTRLTIIAVVTCIGIVFVVFDNLLFTHVYLGDTVVARGWIYGPLVVLHYGYFIPMLGAGVIAMHMHAQKAPKERRSYLHMHDRAALIGVLPIIIIVFVLRLFGFSNLLWTVPFVALGWIILATHTLIRFHVQSLKLFAAEVVVLTMIILLFANIFISEQIFNEIAKVFIFIIFTAFGLLFLAQLQRAARQQREVVSLNIKLRESTNRIAEANFKLKDINEQKSRLMSFASHQIKNPLTSIKGFASLIAEGSLGKLNTKTQHAAQTILSSSDTLVRTVDDFLNSSRIELGQMEYSWSSTTLHNILDESIELLAIQATNKGITLTAHFTDQPITVRADVDKLRHALFNIIDNAIKYTNKGGVTVNLALDSQTHEAVIDVTDTGIGIATHDLLHIFERFYRADNRNVQGSGLGLYLAREILEAHNGSVVAQSRGSNCGTTFIIRLPLYTESTTQAQH